jgi:hypothetical protein
MFRSATADYSSAAEGLLERFGPSPNIEDIITEIYTQIKTLDGGNEEDRLECVSKRGRFEVRSSNEVHDWVIFVDDRCWVIGQSIKDAAKKELTYTVEYSGAASMKGIYEPIWNNSIVAVKSWTRLQNGV